MDDLDAFVTSGAALLGIPLDPAWQDGVVANLRVILRQAEAVMAAGIADDTEPAPVFGA